MRRTSFVQSVSVLFATTFLAVAPYVHSQNVPDQPSKIDDIVFSQISLTVDGVYGVDTTGQAWKYDFERGEFDRSTAIPSDGSGAPGNRGGEADLPVEVRCTEEITVRPYEKSVVVGRDEFVDGDVTAIGKITVRGWVKGSVQSVSGPVIISEGGQVDGDIRSPEITVRRGAVHLGRQILTDPLEFPKGLTDKFETAGLWIVFGFTLFFLLATFLYLTLMPNQVETFGHCVTRYPVKSAAVGLLFVFGLPILLLLLAITLIGILLIPLVPIAYLFAISLGVITTGKLVGSRLLRIMGGEFHPLASTGIGLLIIMAMWALVASLLGSSSQVAFGFGIAALVISILISCFPICAGVGAAVLTRFGFRKHISLRDRLAAEQAAVPAPAPPPIRRTTPFDMPGQPPTPPPPPTPPSVDPPN